MRPGAGRGSLWLCAARGGAEGSAARALVTRDTVEAEVRQYMSQLKGMCACPPCPQTPSSCHEQTARPPVAQSDRLKVAAMRVCPCALERSIEARHAEGPTRREAPRRRRSL